MEQFAREDVRDVLKLYGIKSAQRATGTDPTEEVILLRAEDYVVVEIDELTQALMDVLPHMKVWVAPISSRWKSEPI